jgi:hypothetical protein
MECVKLQVKDCDSEGLRDCFALKSLVKEADGVLVVIETERAENVNEAESFGVGVRVGENLETELEKDRLDLELVSDS